MLTQTVCIIGGTFDPIHNGHLRMARAAQAQCQADEVWFMPAGDPWQKKGQVIASAEHRATMVAEAIKGVRSWHLERLEIDHQHDQGTYTAESLETLADKYPTLALNFIIGTDQLANLTTWKYWQSLFDYARIGVVDRNDFKVPNELKHHLMHDRLFRVPMPLVAISSTHIRETFHCRHSDNPETAAQAQVNLENWLPAPVWKYLQEHPLYSEA